MFLKASEKAKRHRHILEDNVEQPLMTKDFSHGYDVLMFDPLQHATFLFAVVYREIPYSDDVGRGATFFKRDKGVVGPWVPNVGHEHHVTVFFAKTYIVAALVLIP